MVSRPHQHQSTPKGMVSPTVVYTHGVVPHRGTLPFMEAHFKPSPQLQSSPKVRPQHQQSTP
eukprot:1159088-Pelagomonas_calceolata.AAC.11